MASDSWQQALLYIFALGGIGCLWILSKRKVSFSQRVFTGLLIGLMNGVDALIDMGRTALNITAVWLRRH